jgi:hypothetical protein
VIEYQSLQRDNTRNAERYVSFAPATRRVGLWVEDGGAGVAYGELSGIALVPYATPGVNAVLLVAQDQARPGLGPALQQARAAQPGTPYILATAWTPANLRWLKDIAVDDVISADRLSSELRPAVEKLVAIPALERLASGIGGAAKVPADLRVAMATALRSTPPVHTVQRLAWIGGLPRSRLFKVWRRYSDEVGLSEFLHMIMVVRLLDCARPDRRVDSIVGQVGITRRTAERLVRRYCRRSLAQAARDPHEPRAALEERLHRITCHIATAGTPRPSQLPHLLAPPPLAVQTRRTEVTRGSQNIP